MAEVAVTVNGHAYTLGCADGEENRIRRLAQYIDAKIGEFVKDLGQAGEALLILLAALVITDELAEVNHALEEERRRVRAAAGPAAADAAAGHIASLAERIEAIAARLEAS